jgi:hypothetical protein
VADEDAGRGIPDLNQASNVKGAVTVADAAVIPGVRNEPKKVAEAPVCKGSVRLPVMKNCRPS